MRVTRYSSRFPAFLPRITLLLRSQAARRSTPQARTDALQAALALVYKPACQPVPARCAACR